MKVKKVDKINDAENFTDIRFSCKDKAVFEAFERVKSYSPDVCLSLCSESGEQIAVSYANENTWCGQRTLFISSIRLKNAASLKDSEQIIKSFLDYYTEFAPANGYDALLLENENKDLCSLFEKCEMKNIRELVNFSVNRSDLIKNLNYRSPDIDTDAYLFKCLPLEDIYKYSSFQDSRPGWNTSNLSIVKNKFNTFLALMDKASSVYAICIFDERFGIVSRIAVHPLSRKKGFGTVILKEAIHKMDSTSVVVPDIISESQPSILFLTNMGFESIQTKYEYHKENFKK